MPALPQGAEDTAVMPSGGPHSGAIPCDGRKRPEMLSHGQGPDPRTAASVWNAERLVKVQVAHVRPDCVRAGTAPHQRIEVGAVQIDLAPRSWTRRQMSRMASSNTPCVEG